MRPATVSTWRTRFAQHRLAGPADTTRPGNPRVYDDAKRYKRADRATAVIWRLLMVAGQQFRRLEGAEFLPEVHQARFRLWLSARGVLARPCRAGTCGYRIRPFGLTGSMTPAGSAGVWPALGRRCQIDLDQLRRS